MPAYSVAEIEERKRLIKEREEAAKAKKAPVAKKKAPAPKKEEKPAAKKAAPKKSMFDKLKPAKKSSCGSKSNSSKKK